jgi:subtilisin family serine protease
VVVAIIDAGCDFAHPNFRNEDGSTRLLALWHQDGKTRRGDEVLYGRCYTRAQIDRALRSRNPYRSLGYRPHEEPNGKGAHGTHVMDIAAGNGRGTRQPGVAPEADLIFVDISMADAAREGKLAFGYFMGDSVLMLEALDYIFWRAGPRPCVVNLSLGTNGGPHDGSSLVEQGIDALLRDQPDRAVVIAAGNSQVDRVHAQGKIAARAGKSLTWDVTQAGGELECWYRGGPLQVTLVGPDGREFRPVGPGGNATFGIGRKPYLFIGNRWRDPNNGLNQVNIWLEAGLPAGGWRVRLRSLSRAPIDWHAWIERAPPDAQATFRHPQASHTLGSISTGFQSIVVGAYDAHRKGFPLSLKSSAGTTRDGRRKPELSAPGHEVLAARSRLRSKLVPRSGTSMAAPAVSGLVALIYAQAKRTGRSLTIGKLREKLLRHLDRSPPAGRKWHPRYGFGRASAKALGK